MHGAGGSPRPDEASDLAMTVKKARVGEDEGKGVRAGSGLTGEGVYRSLGST